MKTRDAALRLKRFELTEKARKVASMEAMVTDFEHIAGDLMRQISAEEERTGVKDCTHFAYSTFAKAARLRRSNLLVSAADLKLKLDTAKREQAQGGGAFLPTSGGARGGRPLCLGRPRPAAGGPAGGAAAGYGTVAGR